VIVPVGPGVLVADELPVTVEIRTLGGELDELLGVRGRCCGIRQPSVERDTIALGGRSTRALVERRHARQRHEGVGDVDRVGVLMTDAVIASLAWQALWPRDEER